MSYLNLLEGIPDFSKAVISLWFRAPVEAVKRAAQSRLQLPGSPAGFFILQGILPLVTFGKPQVNKNYVVNPEINVAVDVENAHEPDPVFMSSIGYTAQEPYDVDPCFVGLLCFDNGEFSLTFNLQTG